MRVFLLILLFTSSLFAKLHVSVTYPYIGELVKEVAADKAKITVLSKGSWDPHFVVPKPSLIAKLRDSDLLIINGGSLEIGWLPPLIKSANNPRILEEGKGFVDLSHFVTMQDIPPAVDRSMGDVHAEGNPHYSTDPHNIISLAKVIMLKFTLMDKENSDFYRQNFTEFEKRWQAKLAGWDARMKPCEGKNVVQYHELYNYFFRRYQINNIANIEPLPGISPSSKQALSVIESIKDKNVTLILQDVYHNKKTADFIAKKTGIDVVMIPHDVGALKEIDSLEKLYETMIKRVCP